ncbi:YidH family protein [Actinophytocola sp.]|jgi:putative membrane protein|uniref:YidH family protein n=1 Tax=Actinophytocola sp. TaxID=1872138 RepID=UPI002EDB2459
MSRWATRLRETGEDPDPRFSFANERTFLAWIRTALALIAGGIGLEAFAPELVVPGLRQVLAALLVLSGVGTSTMAFRRWLRSELAMREGKPLPPPTVAPWLSYGVAVVALAVFVFVVVANV